eukprot:CAMPEP_0175526082 /NCGR_PEP_ID=MMETSP0096-20121207/19436_1 /TAXON_ID=311494 /ORGANISM="Alexandrium monilatum, Strain CCMP3105" /LENGTH=189 /DNA_ID=CAMNT_0016828709 /DNA_START=84 /DNA_END=653 /DNA_ORIENTATION=+
MLAVSQTHHSSNIRLLNSSQAFFTAGLAPFFSAAAQLLQASLALELAFSLISMPSRSLESSSGISKSPDTSSPSYVPFQLSFTLNSKPSRGLPRMLNAWQSPVTVALHEHTLVFSPSNNSHSPKILSSSSLAATLTFFSSHVPAEFHLEPAEVLFFSADTASSAAASSSFCGLLSGSRCASAMSRFQYV